MMALGHARSRGSPHCGAWVLSAAAVDDGADVVDETGAVVVASVVADAVAASAVGGDYGTGPVDYCSVAGT